MPAHVYTMREWFAALVVRRPLEKCAGEKKIFGSRAEIFVIDGRGKIYAGKKFTAVAVRVRL